MLASAHLYFTHFRLDVLKTRKRANGKTMMQEQVAIQSITHDIQSHQHLRFQTLWMMIWFTTYPLIPLQLRMRKRIMILQHVLYVWMHRLRGYVSREDTWLYACHVWTKSKARIGVVQFVAPRSIKLFGFMRSKVET